MKIFLINLTRRADRLAAMTGRLDALGLTFERVPAVDAKAKDFRDAAAHLPRNGPLGTIGDGMAACALSHARAWQALLDSGTEYGLVLEDDAAFSLDLPAFLDAFSAARPDVALTKLERFRNERGVFVGKAGLSIGGRTVRRLHSLHAGGAGYILSRRGAEVCLEKFATINLPIDHFLFNPVRGSVFEPLKVHQVVPALIRQEPDVGAKSDTAASRQIGQHDRMYRAMYHLRRGFFEAQPAFGLSVLFVRGRIRLERLQFQ